MLETVELGKIYKLKCGWGEQIAKLERIEPYTNKETGENKLRYIWRASSADGKTQAFRFCSYDLEDTSELEQPKNKSCCDKQRIKVDEDFSYEAMIDERGILLVQANDYESEGYYNLRCENCGHSFDISEMEVETV